MRLVRRMLPGLLVLLACGRLPAQAPSTGYNLDHLTGLWYEIARLPDKAQKVCVGDAIMLNAHADNPGQLQMVMSCKTLSDVPEVHNATMTVPKKSAGDVVKVTRLWPFKKTYRILAADPGGAWIVLGTPNKKNAWIYSHTPSLSAETLSSIEGQMAAQGFNAAHLIPTPQSRRDLQITQ